MSLESGTATRLFRQGDHLGMSGTCPSIIVRHGQGLLGGGGWLDETPELPMRGVPLPGNAWAFSIAVTAASTVTAMSEAMPQ
jgi:hypothetical protein